MARDATPSDSRCQGRESGFGGTASLSRLTAVLLFLCSKVRQGGVDENGDLDFVGGQRRAGEKKTTYSLPVDNRVLLLYEYIMSFMCVIFCHFTTVLILLN